MLKALTKYVSKAVLTTELAHQKKAGYRLEFHNLPESWLQGFALVDMTFTWRKYGLPIRGLNYFTVGALSNGTTSRFSTESSLYQSWLGGYIFQSKKPLHWHTDGYLRLAEADQKGWLRRFGSKSPEMNFGKLTDKEELTVAGKKAVLYSWQGITQSDVGASSHTILTKLMMDGMADMMNTLTPGLALEGENFIPPTAARTPFEELLISGYMILVNIDAHTKAVLYVCMVGDNKPDHQIMKRLIKNNIRLVKVDTLV